MDLFTIFKILLLLVNISFINSSNNNGYFFKGREKRSTDTKIYASLPVKINCTIFCDSLHHAKDRTVPEITCQPTESVIYANKSQRTATVSWKQPIVSDNEAVKKVVLIHPIKISNGGQFSPGKHQVMYMAEDMAGHINTCAFEFEVKLKQCPFPNQPKDSTISCPNTPEGHFPVWGETCRFGCTNSPYAIYQQCLENGKFSGGGSQTCPVSGDMACSAPNLPANSKIDKCTNGNNYLSVCTLICDSGFKMKTSDKKNSVQCLGGLKGWSTNYVECVDTTPPVISNCPSSKIITLEKNQNSVQVTWTIPTANDAKDGNVPVKLLSGNTPGSTLFYDHRSPLNNIYKVVYTAYDSDMNMAKTCEFTVTLKVLTCPPIEQKDNLVIQCTEPLTLGAKCSFACSSGLNLVGMSEVTCEKNTATSKAHWNWGSGGTPSYCQNKSCPALKQPVNGALTCIPITDGEYCTFKCNSGYDVPRSIGANHEWVCHEPYGWQGKNADYVPHCTVKQLATKITLKNEITYYSTICLNTTLSNLKHSFTTTMASSEFKTNCTSFPTCRFENVTIGTCLLKNSNDQFSHEIKLIFHLTVTIVYASNNDINVLNGNLENQLYAMSNQVKSEVIAKLFDIQGFQTNMSSYQSNPYGPEIVCGEGMIPRYSTFTCASCSRGTIYNRMSDTCTICPRGTYQDKDGQFHCKSCPNETTTKSVESWKASDCIELCPKGYYSVDGMRPCSTCPDLTYQDKIGKSECKQCPAGATATTTGLHSKEQCQYEPCKQQNPCGTNGVCLTNSSQVYCYCINGYSGAHCDMAPNKCIPNPCYNGGTCMPKNDSFVCTCDDYSSGMYCEIYKNDYDVAYGPWSHHVVIHVEMVPKQGFEFVEMEPTVHYVMEVTKNYNHVDFKCVMNVLK